MGLVDDAHYHHHGTQTTVEAQEGEKGVMAVGPGNPRCPCDSQQDHQDELGGGEEPLGDLDELPVVGPAEGLDLDCEVEEIGAHGVLLRYGGGRGPRFRLSVYSIAPFTCFVNCHRASRMASMRV